MCGQDRRTRDQAETSTDGRLGAAPSEAPRTRPAAARDATSDTAHATARDPAAESARDWTCDRARRWRPPGLAGVELFEAEYVRHTFPRHAHDAVAVGVVDEGAGEFWCRGANHPAPRDTLILIGAEEPHTGGVPRGGARTPNTAPLVYRMLYLDAAWIDDVLGAASARRATFDDPAPRDPATAEALRLAHRVAAGAASTLERESALAGALGRVLATYGRTTIPGERPRAVAEPHAVATVRAYLDAHLREQVSLRTLARMVGLHPAYLNRAFRAGTGLPPHAYQTHRRVEHARALLAAGEPVSSTAWLTGFADQSHLTRHFRRAVGVTPGAYRAAVAPGARSSARATVRATHRPRTEAST
jgi:AraC-like DNA-binding protein